MSSTMLDSKKQQLVRLIETFDTNKSKYTSQGYNEANTRLDFIDKFFSLLDWDVGNSQGFAEEYRDVVVEDKLVIAGKPKAPDYSFRIGGQRKFFVEAKKPAVNVKDAIDPAYQVRRYGYTAKVPLSILTDFEEFAIYDTRIKPNANDKASVARIFYCKFDEYIENFEYIYDIFAKPSIQKGSFDKYVDDAKRKKGTSEVDKEFLKTIDTWREHLAKNIALRNKGITIHELNYSVHTLIDRIIFLRIAEDRKMETYNSLGQCIEKGKDASDELHKIFAKADKKYNAGLFGQEKFFTGLEIDDKILEKIIKETYYPACPYAFDVLGVEILGHIYEQFLGKTIRLTVGGSAKVEEKPEVRKAGGVYYTPQYIVDYIVKNTVGEKIKKLSPDKISELNFVDPACGSGSFLLGVYKYLLDYHIHRYTADEKRIKKALKDRKIYESGMKNWRLTIEEKQHILVNNIYGVDIDEQAVEVTKLSLYLKLMEGESEDTTGGLFKFSDMKLLPSLKDNIKCGNSLIGTDFYDGRLLPDEEQHRRVNAFDREEEFPTIFNPTEKSLSGTRGSRGKGGGGFDCVVGNPPYGAELTDEQRRYLRSKFKISNTDTAALFMVLGIQLSNTGGLCSFIIPKSFTYASNRDSVRKRVIFGLSKIIDCSKVWSQVRYEMSIFVYLKGKKNLIYKSYIRNNQDIDYIGDFNKSLLDDYGFIVNGISKESLILANKIKIESISLNDLINNQRGAIYQKYIVDSGYYKVLGGKQIQRYFQYKEVKGYLKKDTLTDKKAFINKGSILAQRIVAHVTKPHPRIIITATLGDSFDRKRYVIVDTINQLTNNSEFDARYILGVLNSTFISRYCYRFVFAKAIRTMQFDNPTTKSIPFPKISLDNSKYKRQHDMLVTLVNQMLDTQKKLHSANIDKEKELYKKQITLLDKKIDGIVFGLYGLSEEERRVVLDC